MALTPSFFLASSFSVGQTSPHCGTTASAALYTLQAISVHSTGSYNGGMGGDETEGRKGRQILWVPPFLLCSSIEQHKRKQNSFSSPLPRKLQTHTNTRTTASLRGSPALGLVTAQTQRECVYQNIHSTSRVGTFWQVLTTSERVKIWLLVKVGFRFLNRSLGCICASVSPAGAKHGCR